MGMNQAEFYEKYGLKLIGAFMQTVAGKPRKMVVEENLYRQHVIDPSWETLPQPMRMLGRSRLRWDEVLLALRTDIFVAVQDKLGLRKDAPERMKAAVIKLFGSAPRKAAPAKPPEDDIPWAGPARAPTKPALSKDTVVVGIDLGTTYSVIAHLDALGRPTSIPNSVGEIITPSVVLFDDAGPVVGKEAVQAAAMEPEKVADCAKRDMGSKAYRKKINGEFLPPEVISSFILKSLKADAQRKLGQVRKAVITVPAYFDEARRRATMDAGKLAGLEVLDIINEPTAAAIAYGYQTGFLNTAGRTVANKPMRVLVYDLGGGTFDVTIVEIKGTSFKALATDGDVCLGGKDWDEVLIGLAVEQFKKQHREDPRDNPVSMQELWNAAEIAKKTLTERPKATMYVNHLGSRLKVEITRQEFEEATAALLGRTRTTSEIVVRQAGLTWSAIDKVLLVGGSTRMPMVVRMLENIAGKPPERSISPDEAVAHGAALYANLLLREKLPHAGPPQFSVTNINSHSLGIVGVDPQTGRKRNQILIPKNSPLPASVGRVFKTHKNNQRDVVVTVVEGESERPEACAQVGVFKIANLPQNLPAGTPVEVRYSYQTNGELRVSGKVGSQPSASAVSTVFQRENSLGDEDMELWTEYVTLQSGEELF
jgi:molecular chaperone DnaK